jgi:hypothetical protein
VKGGFNPACNVFVKNFQKNFWKNLELFPPLIMGGYIYFYMKNIIKRIIKEESTEKEIIGSFKKLIDYFEPIIVRELFLSLDEIDRNGNGNRNRNTIGGLVTRLSNQRLKKEYPGYYIEYGVEDETDEVDEILYYYLVDKDGNDILKYSNYI